MNVLLELIKGKKFKLLFQYTLPKVYNITPSNFFLSNFPPQDRRYAIKQKQKNEQALIF